VNEKRTPRWHQPFSFAWTVPEFEIAHAFEIDLKSGARAAKQSTFLIDRRAVGISQGRRYLPLRQHNGLFRTFADLEPTDAGILAFANAYGPLGGALSKTVSRTGKVPELFYAELLDEWREMILSMKTLVGIWEGVRSKNQQFLKRLVHWHPNTVVATVGSSTEVIAAPDLDAIAWMELRQGDLLYPAKLYLQRRINDQLTKFPSQIRLLRENGNFLLFITPSNLAAALWFQFARAVEGERNYRVCEQCRRWFEIGGGGSRTDARWCGNPCKQRAYRAGMKVEAKQQTKRKRGR
jgi:hypothetical protein